MKGARSVIAGFLSGVGAACFIAVYWEQRCLFRRNLEQIRSRDNDKFESTNLSLIPDLHEQLRQQRIYGVRDVRTGTKYMACVPPKNGCTYHYGLMQRVVGMKDYDSVQLHHYNLIPTIQLSWLPAKEIQEWMEDIDVPKYIVVRNPMTRVLSAYLGKVENFLPDEEKNPHSFAKWVFKQFSFGEAFYGRSEVDDHWRPQTQFCGFKYEDLHDHFVVFRVEEPEEYLDYLYKHLPGKFLDDGWGLGTNISFRQYALEPRMSTEKTSEKMLEYYQSLEVFDRVALEMFHDIEMLGYQDEVLALRKQIESKAA